MRSISPSCCSTPLERPRLAARERRAQTRKCPGSMARGSGIAGMRQGWRQCSSRLRAVWPPLRMRLRYHSRTGVVQRSNRGGIATGIADRHTL